MTDGFGYAVAVAGVWLAIGLGLSRVMGKRGHDAFAWFVLGMLVGPLAVVLALEAWRHGESPRPARLGYAGPAPGGGGPVDLLVGYDGSLESGAAIEAAQDMLGDRLGRLTVATVVPYDAGRAVERTAMVSLERQAGRAGAQTPEFEVLHGRAASSLRRRAAQGGYNLLAVGTRGAGVSKAIFGSAASELASQTTVPVLLVGAAQPSERRRVPSSTHDCFAVVGFLPSLGHLSAKSQ